MLFLIHSIQFTYLALCALSLSGLFFCGHWGSDLATGCCSLSLSSIESCLQWGNRLLPQMAENAMTTITVKRMFIPTCWCSTKSTSLSCAAKRCALRFVGPRKLPEWFLNKNHWLFRYSSRNAGGRNRSLSLVVHSRDELYTFRGVNSLIRVFGNTNDLEEIVCDLIHFAKQI